MTKLNPKKYNKKSQKITDKIDKKIREFAMEQDFRQTIKPIGNIKIGKKVLSLFAFKNYNYKKPIFIYLKEKNKTIKNFLKPYNIIYPNN